MLTPDLIVALDRELARDVDTSIAASLVSVRVQLRKAEEDPAAALHAIRSIAGVCVRALTAHGCPQPDQFDAQAHSLGMLVASVPAVMRPQVEDQLAAHQRTKALAEAAERLQAGGFAVDAETLGRMIDG
jgi:hypothetical protein